MPAPNSILKPTKNPFAPVDKTYKIYRKCLEICLKLPKRYTFLVSQNFMDSAHNLRKFAKGANSIMPTNKHEVQARRDCWLKARIYLQTRDVYLNFHSWIMSLDGNYIFNICKNAIKYFNELFPELNRYRPLKTNRRKYRIIDYIARSIA